MNCYAWTHKWSNWSGTIRIPDFYGLWQVRTCSKCGMKQSRQI